jgi:hypothetical protein
MTNNPAAPARDGNPWAKFGKGPDYRVGSKTPAKSNPVESKCVALRITVERGKGYQAYRFLAGGSFAFFPCDLNTILKPLVGDLRAEDDMKVNWTLRWFIDAKGYRIVTRVADTTTGEVLAETSVQPALIETTIDENTGQLTTVKQKLDPFGKPVDPVKVAMRQLVFQASGNENDYDWTTDRTNYPRDTKEWKMELSEQATDAILNDMVAEEEFGEGVAAQAIAEQEARIDTQPLVKAAEKKVANTWANDDEKFAIFSKRLTTLATTYGIDPGHAFIEGVRVLKVKVWGDYTGTANEALKAIETAWKPAEPPEEKTASKKAAIDNVGSVEPPIENEAIQLPKKGQEIDAAKSANKPDSDGVIQSLPIPEIILPSQPSGIIPFRPSDAIARAKAFSDVVKHLKDEKVLVDGKDYGVIPGTGDKPSLLKPGAEKLCNAFRFCPRFLERHTIRQFDVANPLFYFEIECQLVQIDTGLIVATGIGICHTMEDKYRWRNAERTCPHCGKASIIKGREEYGGGWICFAKKGGCGAKFKDGDKTITDQEAGKKPNEDVFSLINTVSKMAQKRALVAATLIGANASEFFTQDVEDFGFIDAEIVA